MTILEDYTQFDGRHWETGSVHNYLAYRGFEAPHTGAPYSEALLMGVSGGAVMGYFTFEYEGWDPMCRILTRNTFNPMETMLSRLGIVQHRLHTASPEKGVANLLDTLDSGVPAIVWADMFSLPYNAPGESEQIWAMWPVVVYGYHAEADCVWIADRARVPLTATTAALEQARARVKKERFRVLTLDPPNPEKLVSAVQAGIWDCIKLFTEKPPKGSKNNFGLQALRFWADMLRSPKGRVSWNKVFPPGRKMYAGLREAYFDIRLFGKDSPAERDVYADFLDEAAVILDRPALGSAAERFRNSGQAWQALLGALLPDSIPDFQEARALLHSRHQLFLDKGDDSREERREINRKLDAITEKMETAFPLGEMEVERTRQELADRVMAVHDCEREAVETLRAAMA